MKVLFFFSWLAFAAAAYYAYEFYNDTLAKQAVTAQSEASDEAKISDLKAQVQQLTANFADLTAQLQQKSQENVELRRKLGLTQPSSAVAFVDPVSTTAPTMPTTSSPVAFPSTITTISGTTYQECKFDKATPDGISFFHSTGVAHIPFTDLDPALAASFGYDQAGAQATAKHAATLQTNDSFQNGDFSHGDDHWQGDGKMPQAYARDNPAALTDPLTSKGLIVTLNSSSWTRIYQTFASGNSTHYSIVVTYKLSPNISLSRNAADYADISKKIQIPGFENFGSLPMQPGDFYGTIGDPTSTSMSMELFVPPVGSSQVQTYQHSYPPVPISPTKTFALAFPPGTGTVVILSVDVTAN
jgi:hypothetical protein